MQEFEIMLVIPMLHFLLSLIITALFCAAAALSFRRAPHQFLWLSLIAASSCLSSVSGAINLMFLNLIQKGRQTSELTSLLTAQGAASTLATVLLCAGAATIVIYLLSERPRPVSDPSWQNR